MRDTCLAVDVRQVQKPANRMTGGNALICRCEGAASPDGFAWLCIFMHRAGDQRSLGFFRRIPGSGTPNDYARALASLARDNIDAQNRFSVCPSRRTRQRVGQQDLRALRYVSFSSTRRSSLLSDAENEVLSQLV